MERGKSKEIYLKSCQMIPGGVNSPVRSFPGLNQVPLVAAKGEGEFVFDVDGNRFIDFCGSWGALIHGHAHPQVIEGAKRRMDQGSSFGITTEIEAQLAEWVIENLPHIEKVRFVSSGTEATMTAIRLARAFTQKDLIIKFAGHYHGHADSFLIQAGSGALSLGENSSSAGVPSAFVQYTLSLPFNDFEACQKAFSLFGEKIAGVIVEPVAANMGVVPPEKGFLELLRDKTKAYGALLIFDEVITGFRLGLGGATLYYQVIPDLCCFGKIIGGGFPAAAFGGKKQIMDHLAPLGSVYQAGTLSGNPVAMEGGYQSLQLCQATDFYQKLKKKTDLITEPLREWIARKNLNLSLQQVGSLFTLFFGKKKVRNLEEAKECSIQQFNRFFQALFNKGIYFAPSQFEANFVSAVHSEESLGYTRDCLLEILSDGSYGFE